MAYVSHLVEFVTQVNWVYVVAFEVREHDDLEMATKS